MIQDELLKEASDKTLYDLAIQIAYNRKVGQSETHLEVQARKESVKMFCVTRLLNSNMNIDQKERLFSVAVPRK